jgi:hypothetical protein
MNMDVSPPICISKYHPPLEAEVEIPKEFHFTVKPVNLTLSKEYELLNSMEGTSLSKDFGIA